MFCNKNISLAWCYVKNVSGLTAMSFLSETNIKKAFEWNLCCLRSKKVRDAVLRRCRIVHIINSRTNIHNEEREADGHVSDDLFNIQLMTSLWKPTIWIALLTKRLTYWMESEIQHWFCLHKQHWFNTDLNCIELFFTQNISQWYTCLSKRDARIKLWISRKGFTKVYHRVPAPLHHCGNTRALQTTYQPQELTPPWRDRPAAKLT